MLIPSVDFVEPEPVVPVATGAGAGRTELGSCEMALMIEAIADEAGADGIGAVPEGEAPAPVSLEGMLVMTGVETLLGREAIAPAELTTEALLMGTVALGSVMFTDEGARLDPDEPGEPDEAPENSSGPGMS